MINNILFPNFQGDQMRSPFNISSWSLSCSSQIVWNHLPNQMVVQGGVSLGLQSGGCYKEKILLTTILAIITYLEGWETPLLMFLLKNGHTKASKELLNVRRLRHVTWIPPLKLLIRGIRFEGQVSRQVKKYASKQAN